MSLVKVKLANSYKDEDLREFWRKVDEERARKHVDEIQREERRRIAQTPQAREKFQNDLREIREIRAIRHRAMAPSQWQDELLKERRRRQNIRMAEIRSENGEIEDKIWQEQIEKEEKYWKKQKEEFITDYKHTEEQRIARIRAKFFMAEQNLEIAKQRSSADMVAHVQFQQQQSIQCQQRKAAPPIETPKKSSVLSTEKSSVGEVQKSVHLGAKPKVLPVSSEQVHNQNNNVSKQCASAGVIPRSETEQKVHYYNSWKRGQLTERDRLILSGVVSPRNLGEYAMLQKNTDPQRWAKLTEDHQFNDYTRYKILIGDWKPTEAQKKVMEYINRVVSPPKILYRKK